MKLKDYWEYVTIDEQALLLDNGRTATVISVEGEGMPPIDFVTQRGPFQHGESFRDFFLQPRIVQLIVRRNFCSREEYLTGRLTLLDILRPNRRVAPEGTVSASGASTFTTLYTASARGSGTLRKHLSNGQIWNLDAFIEAGPNFAPREIGLWDELSYHESLRFIAFNPVWYSQALTISSFTASTDQLVFPATFPIVFDSFEVSDTIQYNGTWLEYPEITVLGPITGFTIRNVTTGELIQLNYAIANNESVVFDLREGVKSVTNQNGDNLISFVTSVSDLASFHLEPEPFASNGNNQITVYGTATDSRTRVSLAWRRRMIGI